MALAFITRRMVRLWLRLIIEQFILLRCMGRSKVDCRQRKPQALMLPRVPRPLNVSSPVCGKSYKRQAVSSD